MNATEIARKFTQLGMAFTPNAYMRTARPELFSDTEQRQQVSLPADQFEFYLDQLTAKKRESQFEEFGRRLAQLEICPNLLPQTGPTGGGDSKTDAATYPVAEALAKRCCWVGSAGPSDGDWAFAMSCMKKWRDKLQSDVAKIAALPRKFTKVFFLTNQPVRDKVRAELEVELGCRFGFDVRILDRGWIVAKVTENHREELAIETLGLEVSPRTREEPGPRDLARQRRLDALLHDLGQPELYHENDYALALDYLAAADLSASLEKPRHETEGLYTRAENLAAEAGHDALAIRCYYEHAWKSYFWFNDVRETERLYAKIEPLISGRDDAEEWEKCQRLITLQETAALTGLGQVNCTLLTTRAATVRSELERLSRDVTMPNNALQAETVLRALDLRAAVTDPTKAAPAIAGLKHCLKRAAGLGTFPLKRYTDVLMGMADVFSLLPGYEELFERIEQVTSSRLGETEAGKRRLDLGIQLFQQGKAAEALKHFGLAKIKLFKEETLEDGLRACIGCAGAYQKLGLLWAARMEMLVTTHAVLRTLEAFHEAPTRGFFAVKEMAWTELKLGRIEPFLAWHHFAWNMLGQLHSLQIDVQEHEKELLHQDGAFGHFLLNLPPREAFQLRGLLEAMRIVFLGLPTAGVALLFALGRVEEAKLMLPDEIAADDAAVRQFFLDWKVDPRGTLFPRKQEAVAGNTRTFETTIMGVRYVVTCPNTFGPITFCEDFLGVLESVLATAKWENLAFVAREVKISVDEKPTGSNPPKVSFTRLPDSGAYSVDWQPDMLEWMQHHLDAAANFMKDLVLQLILSITIDPLAEIEQEFAEWHRNEAFSRALGHTPCGLLLGSTISKECYELAHWTEAAFAPEIFGDAGSDDGS